MADPQNAVNLPRSHAVDYAALVASAMEEGATDLAWFLRQNLPEQWRELYVAAAAHPTNIIHFQSGSFEYFYDHYSGLEATGEVAYDQTVQDRVVAALGVSARADLERKGQQVRRWISEADELLAASRDNGHFMAHCIGGRAEINVFSQDRALNRGWSPQGKRYRQMEKYCYENPGTFCFSRPIYCDGSRIPRWLEFGLLTSDQTLWVEVFDNLVE